MSPRSFGRVFEANRSALVRVRAIGGSGRWQTGFLIGAQGEVVFSARESPKPQLEVELADGRTAAGELLGYDRALALAIGRIDAAHGPFEPLRVATGFGLVPDRWVVALVKDHRGEAKPYAGVVVDRAPNGRAPTSVIPKDVRWSWIEVPGQPGSPILSTEGALVAIAVDDGRRRTRALAIESIVPFLKAVVLREPRNIP